MKQKILVASIITVLIVTSGPIGVRADYKVGNKEFLDALDAAIGNIISSGEYDTIYSSWFSGEVVLTDDSTASTATTFPAAADLTDGGTLDSIIQAGEIVFGSDTTYPPFENLDAGNVVGFDADIAAAIAVEFGKAYNTTVTAKMQSNEWDPIIPDLKSGKFDAILSAMTKTAARAQEIDFTRSYYTSKQGILGKIGGINITDVSDLNNASISIAVQTGTTSDLYATDNLPDADLHGYDSFDLAVAALKNDDVDFLLGDLPVLAYYAVENSADNLKVFGDFGDEELFGIGVRKDSTSGGGFLPLPLLPFLMTLLLLPIVVKKRYRID